MVIRVAPKFVNNVGRRLTCSLLYFWLTYVIKSIRGGMLAVFQFLGTLMYTQALPGSTWHSVGWQGWQGKGGQKRGYDPHSGKDGGKSGGRSGGKSSGKRAVRMWQGRSEAEPTRSLGDTFVDPKSKTEHRWTADMIMKIGIPWSRDKFAELLPNLFFCILPHLLTLFGGSWSRGIQR